MVTHFWQDPHENRCLRKGISSEYFLPLEATLSSSLWRDFYQLFTPNTTQVSSPWSLNRKQELPSSVVSFPILFGQSFAKKRKCGTTFGCFNFPSLSSFQNPLDGAHGGECHALYITGELLKWFLQNVLFIWKYRKYKNNRTPLSSITDSLIYNYGRKMPALTSILEAFLSYKYFFITFSFLFFRNIP